MEDYCNPRTEKYPKQLIKQIPKIKICSNKFLSVYFSGIEEKYKFIISKSPLKNLFSKKIKAINSHSPVFGESHSVLPEIIASIISKLPERGNSISSIVFHQKGKAYGYLFQKKNSKWAHQFISSETVLKINHKIKVSKTKIIDFNSPTFSILNPCGKNLATLKKDQNFSLSCIFDSVHLFGFDSVSKKNLSSLSNLLFKRISDSYGNLLESNDGHLIRNILNDQKNSNYLSEIVRTTTNNHLISNHFHKKRMELMGDLLDTLKHELCNPLFGIDLTIHEMVEQYSESPIVNDLQRIRNQVVRCQKIIDAFTKIYSYSSEVELTELVPFLKDLIVLGKSESHNVTCSFLHQDELENLKIRTIPSILGQVCLNLFTNSCQAIQENYLINNKNGKIQISISRLSENQIEIMFSDNGPGVSPENLPHLFSPFFTTKKTGTGLGLNICKELVKRINGDIRYLPHSKNSLGGANFSIILQDLD